MSYLRTIPERLPMTPGLIAIGVVALLVIIVLVRAVRIVPQALAGVVERLGRYSRTLDAGSARARPVRRRASSRSSTCASRS